MVILKVDRDISDRFLSLFVAMWTGSGSKWVAARTETQWDRSEDWDLVEISVASPLGQTFRYNVRCQCKVLNDLFLFSGHILYLFIFFILQVLALQWSWYRSWSRFITMLSWLGAFITFITRSRPIYPGLAAITLGIQRDVTSLRQASTQATIVTLQKCLPVKSSSCKFRVSPICQVALRRNPFLKKIDSFWNY